MTELATVNVRLSDFERCNADLDRLEDENAKLRDLIADMSKAFFTLDIDHCQACPRDKARRRCQMFVTTDLECAFVTEMRKLGIEADDD